MGGTSLQKGRLEFTKGPPGPGHKLDQSQQPWRSHRFTTARDFIDFLHFFCVLNISADICFLYFHWNKKIKSQVIRNIHYPRNNWSNSILPWVVCLKEKSLKSELSEIINLSKVKITSSQEKLCSMIKSARTTWMKVKFRNQYDVYVFVDLLGKHKKSRNSTW